MIKTFTDGKFNIEVIQIINNIIGLQELKKFLNKYNEGFLIDNSRFSDNSIVIEFPPTNEEYHLSEGLFLTVNADYSITTFEEKEIKNCIRAIKKRLDDKRVEFISGDNKGKMGTCATQTLKFQSCCDFFTVNHNI